MGAKHSPATDVWWVDVGDGQAVTYSNAARLCNLQSVRAFGVLLFEIVTQGATPYGALPWQSIQLLHSQGAARRVGWPPDAGEATPLSLHIAVQGGALNCLQPLRRAWPGRDARLAGRRGPRHCLRHSDPWCFLLSCRVCRLCQSCWQADAARRPTFDWLCKTLAPLVRGGTVVTNRSFGLAWAEDDNDLETSL